VALPRKSFTDGQVERERVGHNVYSTNLWRV